MLLLFYRNKIPPITPTTIETVASEEKKEKLQL